MINKDFAWTFSIEDPATVRYVRDDFIPQLEKDVIDLRRIHKACADKGTETPFGEDIASIEAKAEAAREHLMLADPLLRLRYADDEPGVERFPRVEVITAVTFLTGPYAKEGAIGRLISSGPGHRRRVLFERTSKHLVHPDDATQCALEVDALSIQYVRSKQG